MQSAVSLGSPITTEDGGNRMAFVDPQTVTINAVPVSMPRTGSGVLTGTFNSADGNTAMFVGHVVGRRIRRTIRLTQKKIVSDPLVPAQNIPLSMSAYLMVDTPTNGYTVAEAKLLVDSLVAFLAASSGAKVTQLLGGES
jgi:hypothetical protein